MAKCVNPAYASRWNSVAERYQTRPKKTEYDRNFPFTLGR